MHRGGPMMMLRGLDLTEAQRDQVFQIFHEQAPAFHEQMKQVRQARQNLMKLAAAPSFDESQVRQAADVQAKALSALAVMHAQTVHRVRDILTPEQRARLDERAERRHGPAPQ
jgi:Spy/CpxP family protein refolding chaperone